MDETKTTWCSETIKTAVLAWVNEKTYLNIAHVGYIAYIKINFNACFEAFYVLAKNIQKKIFSNV